MGTAPIRDRPARAAAWILIVGTLLLVANQGLFSAGLPAWTVPLHAAHDPLGPIFLGCLALIATMWISYLTISGRSPQDAQVAGLCVLALFAAVSLSGLVHGASANQWIIGVSWGLLSWAFLLSAVILGSKSLAKVAIIGGGLYCWTSIVIGLLSVTGVVAGSAVETGDQFREWLDLLQWPGTAPAAVALGGLGGNRQVLGATAAMILIIQVLILKRRGLPLLSLGWLVGPAGSLIALCWSMSRTGYVTALAVTLLLLIPWRSFAARLRRTSLFALFVFLPIAPLLTLIWTRPVRASGTWEWRLDLWISLLQRSQEFLLFGWSPAVPLPVGATHAHNLLLETAVVGGMAGLLAAGAWMWQASGVASRAIAAGSLELTGVLLAFLIAGQTEMPINYRTAVFLPHWFIVLLVLGGTIAAFPSHLVQDSATHAPDGRAASGNIAQGPPMSKAS